MECVCASSDEGGVHDAGVLRTAGPSLKELFYQRRLLLLQLGDPLAPLRHLLWERKGKEVKRVTENGRTDGATAWRPPSVDPLPDLSEKSVLVLQPLDGLGSSRARRLGVSC